MTVDSLSIEVADSEFTNNTAQQSYAGGIDMSGGASANSTEHLSLLVGIHSTLLLFER